MRNNLVADSFSLLKENLLLDASYLVIRSADQFEKLDRSKFIELTEILSPVHLKLGDMHAAKLSNENLRQILIDSVRNGFVETFPIMFGDIQAHREDNVEGDGCDGIVGIISFVGTFPWSLIVSFPYETAVGVAGKFAGFEILFHSPDMVDVIGELVNIVAGPISAHFEAAGLQAKMSLPTVARGHNVEVLLPSHIQIQRLHFNSPQGSFRVKIVTAPIL